MESSFGTGLEYNELNNVEVKQRRRTRKSAPKVRTACITCKLRRVKCDETKPGCLRCLKYWGHCEGYTDENFTNFSREVHSGSKAAKIIRTTSISSTANSSLFAGLEIPREPYTGPEFESVEESNLFSTFITSTSPVLSGAFDGIVWDHLLPQLSVTEPFIRYGLAALGGLMLNYLETANKRRHDADHDCAQVPKIYLTVITLYDKSVHLMRVALARTDRSLRDILLSCLFVVCFEGFHGFHYSSNMHAHEGLNLFHTWLTQQKPTKAQLSPLHSPNPAELDDAIVSAMHRLDLQVMFFFDSRSIQKHSTLATYQTPALISMPSAFLSLSQAHAFLNLICRRASHFLASILSSDEKRSPTFTNSKFTSPTQDPADFLLGISIFAQVPYRISKFYDPGRIEYSTELDGWDRAFSPLFDRLKKADDVHRHGAVILLLHSKMMHILLAGAFFTSEMEYDDLLPGFRSIFELSASIWRLHVGSADIWSYNFELGLLPPLFLAATRCRDRQLRRQVIELLSTVLHFENSWASFPIAFIARWLIGVEEEGLPDFVQKGPLLPEECRFGGMVKGLPLRSVLATDEETKLTAGRFLDVLPQTQFVEDEMQVPSPSAGINDIDWSQRIDFRRKTNHSMFSDDKEKEGGEVVSEDKRARITRYYVDLTKGSAQLEYTQGFITEGESRPTLKSHVLMWL